MSRTVSRTTDWKSTYVVVEISPRTTTRPVVVAVSQATRAFGSSRMIAPRMASETWSHILSGWPSVTDSEVNRYWAASTMLMSAKPSTAPRRTGLGGYRSDAGRRRSSTGEPGVEARHLERFVVVGRLEPEDLAEECDPGLEGPPEREGAAKPVTLPLERDVGVRDRLLRQGGDDRLGLRRRHDPVVEALEDQDRARVAVPEL